MEKSMAALLTGWGGGQHVPDSGSLPETPAARGTHSRHHTTTPPARDGMLTAAAC